MTEFARLLAADRGQDARTIRVIDRAGFEDWARRRSAEDRALIEAHRFDGKGEHAFVLLPRGPEFEVVTAVKDRGALTPWCLAKLAAALPDGTYRLADGDPGPAALGWLLAQHRFNRFKSDKPGEERGPRVLVTTDAARIDSTVRLAEAVAMVRDLVDTPAGDMGPADLERAAMALAKEFGADCAVISGKDLGDGYPLIAAVGGAAGKGREPRLIELRWGRSGDPRVAIVGKGVCFDTGGLDLKPGAGMRLMKKDMGGAAHALALARLVMSARLPVRLHLLIPAVENSVSGEAYRPGDVVRSRKGLTVEIDNTDAEGRLVLADALDKAVGEEPELLMDFATLTGAARVALGPDLPAMFVNDDALAAELSAAGASVVDPVWRMPLWGPYDEMLKSDVADLANASNSPMAGSITAAMFLQRFVPAEVKWVHFDTYAWRDSAQPGRPKGGEALGLRAAFSVLQAKFPRT